MTIASLLSSNGYSTAMVGKWHLGMDFPGTKGKRDWSEPTKDMPLDKGFDYFWGIPAAVEKWNSHESGGDSEASRSRAGR